MNHSVTIFENVKPVSLLSMATDLEPVTHNVPEHMIEKINDTDTELLSKSPGWATVS